MLHREHTTSGRLTSAIGHRSPTAGATERSPRAPAKARPSAAGRPWRPLSRGVPPSAYLRNHLHYIHVVERHRASHRIRWRLFAIHSHSGAAFTWHSPPASGGKFATTSGKSFRTLRTPILDPLASCDSCVERASSNGVAFQRPHRPGLASGLKRNAEAAGHTVRLVVGSCKFAVVIDIRRDALVELDSESWAD